MIVNFGALGLLGLMIFLDHRRQEKGCEAREEKATEREERLAILATTSAEVIRENASALRENAAATRGLIIAVSRMEGANG